MRGIRVSLGVYLWPTESLVSASPNVISSECNIQGLVLDAVGDKGGCPLVLLASLSDAGACGTDCCGFKTV